MSKIKNGGLDQYGAEPLEQPQCRTAGIEGVKIAKDEKNSLRHCNNQKQTRQLSLGV